MHIYQYFVHKKWVLMNHTACMIYRNYQLSKSLHMTNTMFDMHDVPRGSVLFSIRTKSPELAIDVNVC